MARDTTHSLQPQTDLDGMSRRLAVLACKQALRSTLEPALKKQFLEAGEQAFETLPAYPYWSGLNRVSQDRMWSLLAGQIDADYERIQSAAGEALKNPTGSLQLGIAVMPEYMRTANIHGQPGGYLLERAEDDLAPGVLYEAGGNLYALGQGIGHADSKAQCLIAHIRTLRPDFKPLRILEMGCSAGAQSSDYPVAYPDASFHAIDLSAGMLRFAHARSELLGSAVQFRQADAAETGYPDESFDLIVSHNMFHEVAADHMPAIMQECHRLLAPGGLLIHQDVPIQVDRLDAWMKAVSGWQEQHNDEPFWMDYATADLPEILAQAGFDREQIKSEYLKAMDGPIPWYVVMAEKPQQ